MAFKETIYSSKVKYKGVFSFKDFYKFAYLWLKEEPGYDVAEKKYSEKIEGNVKKIEVEWECTRKLNDYVKYEMKIEMKIQGLEDIEIQEGNKKIKMNKGEIEMKVKSTFIKDYEGKFETDAFRKFLRGIYDKWIINGMLKQHEDKLAEDSDEFLMQAKAYLDLESK